MTVLAFMSGYGFVSALIQSEDLDMLRVRQAFGLLLLINSGLAVFQIATSGIAAEYYGHPVVGEMLRWQALLYIVIPFQRSS